ncbi:MAG: pyridoxine 5'-phosphate synthase [Candidatus Scalindua sp.]
MVKLCVNVDHVATVREARKTIVPDPVGAAVVAELAGADGITIHLREDRRHIKDRDLRLIREIVKTKLNLEMAASPEIIGIALEVRPDQVTFVPERREEVTTEGGLKVDSQINSLREVISRFHEKGIPVSLFIDPDLEQVRASRESGADYVEINTGKYSETKNESEEDKEFEKICEAVKLSADIGLRVNAGHGLTYKNVTRIARLKEIEEFNIGHNIIARAIFVGLDKAIREMIKVIQHQ